MPRFKPRDWIAPKDLDEALEALKKLRVRPIAGGTGIYELARRGMAPETDALLDLDSLGLEYVKVEGNVLRIGAASRFSWLLEVGLPEIPELAGLREAIMNVKPVQVRNAATVGGAIAISIPFLDFPPAALSYDARAVIITPSKKERVVPLEGFWLDYLLPDLRKGELLTEIRIPLFGDNVGSAFLKLGRTVGDFALVNVCCRLIFNKDGTCRDARIALGGVANRPIRVKEAEEALKNKRLDVNSINHAVDALSKLNPTPSIHGSPWYKREIAKVLVRDALTISAERAGFPVTWS